MGYSCYQFVAAIAEMARIYKNGSKPMVAKVHVLS